MRTRLARRSNEEGDRALRWREVHVPKEVSMTEQDDALRALGNNCAALQTRTKELTGWRLCAAPIAV
jgi:hypothetical protein